LTQLGKEYIIAFVFPEVLMSFFSRIILIVFVSTPFFIVSLSCGDSSGSSTTAGYSLDATDMTAPSTPATTATTCTAYTVGSSTRNYAVITQNATQTGVSYASYTNEGHEALKVIFYTDQGYNYNPLPTTVGPSVSYTSTTGKLIAKYTSTPTDGKAMSMSKTAASTVEFSVSLNASGKYDISITTLPGTVSFSSNIITNAVKY
jgi:hypothetical protein